MYLDVCNQLALVSLRWCDGRAWALCCPSPSLLSAFLSVPQTAGTPVTEGREILIAGTRAFLCMTVSVARQHMRLNWDRIWEQCWLRGEIFVRGEQGRRQGREAVLSAPCPLCLASLLPPLPASCSCPVPSCRSLSSFPHSHQQTHTNCQVRSDV